MKRIILGVSFVGIIILFGCDRQGHKACEDPLGCVRIERGDPVKIGALQVLNGGLKKSGRMHVRAVKMAIDKYGGQVAGHPVELLVEDSGCSREAGIHGALMLTVQPALVGIIGTYCSGAAIGASPVISDAGLVMISGVNSSPSLTSVLGKAASNWHPGYYRTTYNGVKMAELAARFAYQKLEIKRAATINDGDDFTVGLSQVFEDRFREYGGKITASIQVNKGDRDMGPALEAIAYAGAELIYFPLFQPEAEAVIGYVRKITGLKNVRLIASGGIASETFIRNVKSDGIGLYLTATTRLDNQEMDKLTQRYRKKYSEKPYHFTFPYIYDASCILLSAIETIASEDSGGTLIIGRQRLRDYLDNLTDFPGVTGVLSNKGFGDFFSKPFSIIQLEDLSGGISGLRRNVKFTVY